MAVKEKHSHYYKNVRHLSDIDAYRVLERFGVTDPAIQHAVKKLLVAGGRGAGKDQDQDVQEAIDSLQRFQEMRIEDANEFAGAMPSQQVVTVVNDLGGDFDSPEMREAFKRALQGMGRPAEFGGFSGKVTTKPRKTAKKPMSAAVKRDLDARKARKAAAKRPARRSR